MCCTTTKIKKTCLTSFHILLILNHVCESVYLCVYACV